MTLTLQVACLQDDELISAYEALTSESHKLIFTHHLAHLRDWLLPRLMNGQVRVTG